MVNADERDAGVVGNVGAGCAVDRFGTRGEVWNGDGVADGSTIAAACDCEGLGREHGTGT